MADIPPAECPLGYPAHQLEAILGDGLSDFNYWMRGQTVAQCEGRRWDYAARDGRGDYVPDACADHPHGMVVYGCDLRAYLTGRLPLD